MSALIGADALRAALLTAQAGGEEIALLDVREEAEFGPEHILLAIHLPLSRLELRAAWLVPRRSTRIVVCDGGGDGGDEALAQRAATILESHGYGNVAVLDGGVAAWRAAGHATFSGVNVPSKAFGEVVEHGYRTPSISAQELKARIDAGANMVVVDSRPLDEFRVMSIPTATCVPGGELVWRIGALAPDPDTLVVVNCAGRTRSIMGAQSLINAGIPNPVVALRNGTMGWHLAGLALDHGQTRYLPEVSPAQAQDARRRAQAVCARFAVPRIDRATLEAWQAAPDRTTFLLDVRSPEEYLAGHLPGSISAPGGQLVQATDRYVGTLGARLVLVDDDGVRAAMTASWLKQMALHEVAVLDAGLSGGRLPGGGVEAGPGPEHALGLEALRYREIAPEALRDALADGRTQLVDLTRSVAYRTGHIGGARHGVRTRLAALIPSLPAHDLLVLTSGDAMLARYAVAEAEGLTDAEVMVLAGGNEAWREAGLPLVAGEDGLEAEPVDAHLRAYDCTTNIEEAMQAYLDWEVELINRLDEDGTLPFRKGGIPGGHAGTRA
jgi:rhodanese-related sulfurtransferase